jgi:hypothetical protein
MLKYPYKQGFSNVARIKYSKLRDKNIYKEIKHNNKYLFTNSIVTVILFDTKYIFAAGEIFNILRRIPTQ